MAHTLGLLFVYGECGEYVSEEDFNNWYDNEHIPARASVPGFHTLARYKAADSKKPSWLAIYDLSSPAVMQSDAYKSLPAKASSNERNIISNLSLLKRQVYSLISSHSLPTTSSAQLPGKYLLIVHMQPTVEGEAEFNKWYDEEHMKLIANVPGWLRGRRYKLVDWVELAGKADSQQTKAPTTYLAVHELENHDFADTPEFKHASSTPWRTEIMKNVVDREVRVFEKYKVFELPL